MLYVDNLHILSKKYIKIYIFLAIINVINTQQQNLSYLKKPSDSYFLSITYPDAFDVKGK